MIEQGTKIPSYFNAGPHTPEDIKSLCHDIWRLTHSAMPHEEMLASLCVLTGVSLGILMDYAAHIQENPELGEKKY